MMLKLFSFATACALLLPVASPVFAVEELETIRVIGSRSCSGVCVQNFLNDFKDMMDRIVNLLPNEASLEPNESEAKPEVVMPIAEFDNACEVSESERTNRVNTEFSNGFAGRSFPVGTEIFVAYFPSATETFIVTNSNTSGIGTLKPIPGTLRGCN